MSHFLCRAAEEEEQAQSKKALKKQQKEAEKAAKKAEKQAKLVSVVFLGLLSHIRCPSYSWYGDVQWCWALHVYELVSQLGDHRSPLSTYSCHFNLVYVNPNKVLFFSTLTELHR